MALRRLLSALPYLYPFPTDMSALPLDILALAAHRDDVEQTCGGTLLKMAQRGYRTGILDLTQGEMGTRGSAEDRAREAAERRKDIVHFMAAGSRYSRRTGGEHLGKPAESCSRTAGAEAASGDPSLLEGAAS